MGFYTETPKGILLSVQLQPRSSKDQVIGPHGDALKIKITAPPVDGAANAHACIFLSSAFRLPRSMVTIHTGPRSKHKVFLLQGLSLERFEKRLQELTIKKG